MKSLVSELVECIESTFCIDGQDYSNRIIVYPCGEVGISVVNIMKNIYNLTPAFIIDNNKCRYNSAIKPVSFLGSIDTSEYVLLFTASKPELYAELKPYVNSFFDSKKIIEPESSTLTYESLYDSNNQKRFKTEIGKYSYGPICRDHQFIEKIGSFCSFAIGVDYVANHEMKYLTTHPIIYWGKHFKDFELPYKPYRKMCGDYFEGIEPVAEKITKQGRAVIGNDVWLGKNVTVLNSSNIGNGVIAGGGAVITHDIPDYAVVVGVPARIIRFRYSPEQINALNKIKWWDWSDDEIRARYNDLYLPIDDFIKKYYP